MCKMSLASASKTSEMVSWTKIKKMVCSAKQLQCTAFELMHVCAQEKSVKGVLCFFNFCTFCNFAMKSSWENHVMSLKCRNLTSTDPTCVMLVFSFHFFEQDKSNRGFPSIESAIIKK